MSNLVWILLVLVVVALFAWWFARTAQARRRMEEYRAEEVKARVQGLAHHAPKPAGQPAPQQADPSLFAAEELPEADADEQFSEFAQQRDEALRTREVSEFDEVVDGGFGVGSAAPVHDGVMPLGHPVKGKTSGRQYHLPGGPRYDTVEADVWFTDEEAAQRFGFRNADG